MFKYRSLCRIVIVLIFGSLISITIPKYSTAQKDYSYPEPSIEIPEDKPEPKQPGPIPRARWSEDWSTWGDLAPPARCWAEIHREILASTQVYTTEWKRRNLPQLWRRSPSGIRIIRWKRYGHLRHRLPGCRTTPTCHTCRPAPEQAMADIQSTRLWPYSW